MAANIAKLLLTLEKQGVTRSVEIVVILSQMPSKSIAWANLPQNRELANQTLSDIGIDVKELSNIGIVPTHIAQTIPSFSTTITLSQLVPISYIPNVSGIIPVRFHRLHLNQSAPLIGIDGNVHSRYTGKGVKVAVIDTGIDWKHLDLQGRIDLANSKNFTTEGDPDDPMDLNGHGTHVAGIIGGAGHIYKGVAPGVEFIACKVFNRQGRSAGHSIITQAIEWAMQKGVDIINYSGGFVPIDQFFGRPIIPPPWVWPNSYTDQEIVFKNAMDSGIVCCVSAGNEGNLASEGTISMPATAPEVISVGSVYKNGQVISSFSSYGPVYRSPQISIYDDWPVTKTPSLQVNSYNEIDLVAPGGEVNAYEADYGGCFYVDGIISTQSSRSRKTVCTVDEIYRKMSGTSQASPHIAGLAALILEACRDKGVPLGPQKAYFIKGILQNTCNSLDPSIPIYRQGFGLPEWSKIETVLSDIVSGKAKVTDYLANITALPTFP